MILTGMPLERILTMDILTFNALLPLANKVVYRDKAENAWSNFITVNGAMGGKKEGTDKMTKGWLRDVGVTEAEVKKGARNAADFLRDFKIGKGGGKL